MTRIIKDTMTASLAKVQRQLEDLPSQAHEYWVKITPKATGNAKRKTRLTGTTIRAEYDYATYLDEGRSKQARNGMVGPTTEFIRRQLRRIRK